MSVIVFDLDGTLVDSAPDIRAAANRMLEGEGQPPLDLASVISFIGNGLPKLVERVIEARGLNMADHARLTGITLAHYADAPADLSVAYPGMRDALRQLRDTGHILGICTNKPEAPARTLLRGMELDGYFSAVIGGDTLPKRKPDPAPLLCCFETLGARTGIFVGDSEVDAATAQAAGAPFALFTEGYRKSPPEALPHRARFSDYAALPGLVDALLASTS
ncbi:MAG: phosphoglycolate phosphatase [Jhaorihella sp.]